MQTTTPVRQHRLQSPLAVNTTQRVSTPDPFEQSPIDDDDVDLEAAHPVASTTSLRGYHIKSASNSDIDASRSGDVGALGVSRSGALSMGASRSAAIEEEEEMEESQLFPGSDLF